LALFYKLTQDTVHLCGMFQRKEYYASRCVRFKPEPSIDGSGLNYLNRAGVLQMLHLL